MASIITATTTSGLTQSADNSGVLQLASGAGNLVTVPSVTATMLTTASTGINASNITTGTLAVANGGTGVNTLTANNVILGNGTSAPSFVAPGTNGNVLTSNGTTWVSSTPAGGGGALEFISTTLVTTGVSSVSFTGLNASTYIAYMIQYQGVRPSSDNAQLCMRVGTSGGLITSSDYNSSIIYNGVYSGTPSGLTEPGSNRWVLTIPSVRSSTAGGCQGIAWVSQSANATPSFTSSTSWWAPPDNQSFQCLSGGALTSTYSGSVITQVSLFYLTGNINANSRITIYGLKAS